MVPDRLACLEDRELSGREEHPRLRFIARNVSRENLDKRGDKEGA